MRDVVTLDGAPVSLDTLVRVATDPSVEVRIAPEAMERVARARAVVERQVRAYEAGWRAWTAGEGPPPPMDYGITTGFGEFKRIPIPPEELDALATNILVSHAVGVGSASRADDLSHYYPPEVIRAVLLLRVLTFLRGHSGVRPVLVDILCEMLNAGIIPLVPLKGSLGASGDLCPLAHLFCPLVGEGALYVVTPGELRPASPTIHAARTGTGPLALTELLGRPMGDLRPAHKEGLALTNGASFSAAMLALAVHDAVSLAQTADVAAALSLEAMSGCARAFDPQVHLVRGQVGQQASAANLRALVSGSRSVDASGDVQDPYGLRCAPAVHGASRDAIVYVRAVAEAELDAVTDNPLFFPDSEPWDYGFAANWPEGYDGRRRAAYSAGNFHGQPLALAADFLAIAVAELASISERRIQMLLDAHHNRGLPANLIAMGGVNSGYMIAQYTAASLVSENKGLAHPASVDSIPSSANIEDHVSMSTIAARKAGVVLHHAQVVLGIELMVAAQAVEWRVSGGDTPGKLASMTPEGSAPSMEAARAREAAFAASTTPEARARRAASLGVGTGAAYLAVRKLVAPLIADRYLERDVRRMTECVRSSLVLAAAEAATGQALAPLTPVVGGRRAE